MSKTEENILMWFTIQYFGLDNNLVTIYDKNIIENAVVKQTAVRHYMHYKFIKRNIQIWTRLLDIYNLNEYKHEITAQGNGCHVTIVGTYPVSDHGAARLFYGDLGEWADQVRPNPKKLGEFPLTHTSTQCFDDPFAVLVPLADWLDLNLPSHFGLRPLSRLALEVGQDSIIINSHPWQSVDMILKTGRHKSGIVKDEQGKKQSKQMY